MDRLAVETLLPPFGLVTIEAPPGSQDWRVHICIKGPDRRYNWGSAGLSKNDMLRLIACVMRVIAAAGDQSNFNAVAVRERPFGDFGGLEILARFHPDGALVIRASAASSTGWNSELIKDAEQFVRHLRHVVEIGDQMVA